MMNPQEQLGCMYAVVVVTVDTVTTTTAIHTPKLFLRIHHTDTMRLLVLRHLSTCWRVDVVLHTV